MAARFRFVAMLAISLGGIPAFAALVGCNWGFIRDPLRVHAIEPAADRVIRLEVANGVNPNEAMHALLSRGQLQLMSLNCQDLQLFNGAVVLERKRESKVKEIAARILAQGPDIVALQEVGGPESLERFANQYLGGAYRPILFKTNSSTGHHVAFLVRRDLPFTFVAKSFAEQPSFDGHGRAFDRDAVVLIAYWDGKPVMAVLNSHDKSALPRPPMLDGDGTVRRTNQAAAKASIYGDFKVEFPEVPFAFTGDFNADFTSGPENALLRTLGRNAVDAMNDKLPPAKRLPLGDERRATLARFVPYDSVTKAPLSRSEALERDRTKPGSVTWVREIKELDGAIVDPDAEPLLAWAHKWSWSNPKGYPGKLPQSPNAWRRPTDHDAFGWAYEVEPLLAKAGVAIPPSEALAGSRQFELGPLYTHDGKTRPYDEEELKQKADRRLVTAGSIGALMPFGARVGQTKQTIGGLAERKDLILLPRNGGPPLVIEPRAGYTFTGLLTLNDEYRVNLKRVDTNGVIAPGPAVRILRFDTNGKPLEDLLPPP